MSYAQAIRDLRPVDVLGDRRSGLTEAAFRALCGSAPLWHSVDLGDLFIEGARKTGEITYGEMRKADLPDLRGKTVLDIGAFSGWFSFEAERRGAARVVALEYHSWAADWPKLLDHMRRERAAGRVGNPYGVPPEVIDEAGQPGRRAFDATREVLGSRVEPVLSRFEDYDPGHRFDVVLFLGVLYHCESPLSALQKVASLTGECLILETLGVHLPGLEGRAVWDFYGDDSVNNDVTTWWAPNDKGLVDMLRAVGFARVEVKSSTEAMTEEQRKRPRQLRTWVHAWK